MEAHQYSHIDESPCDNLMFVVNCFMKKFAEEEQLQNASKSNTDVSVDWRVRETEEPLIESDVVDSVQKDIEQSTPKSKVPSPQVHKESHSTGSLFFPHNLPLLQSKKDNEDKKDEVVVRKTFFPSLPKPKPLSLPRFTKPDLQKFSLTRKPSLQFDSHPSTNSTQNATGSTRNVGERDETEDTFPSSTKESHPTSSSLQTPRITSTFSVHSRTTDERVSAIQSMPITAPLDATSTERTASSDTTDEQYESQSTAKATVQSITAASSETTTNDTEVEHYESQSEVTVEVHQSFAEEASSDIGIPPEKLNSAAQEALSAFHPQVSVAEVEPEASLHEHLSLNSLHEPMECEQQHVQYQEQHGHDTHEIVMTQDPMDTEHSSASATYQNFQFELKEDVSHEATADVLPPEADQTLEFESTQLLNEQNEANGITDMQLEHFTSLELHPHAIQSLPITEDNNAHVITTTDTPDIQTNEEEPSLHTLTLTTLDSGIEPTPTFESAAGTLEATSERIENIQPQDEAMSEQHPEAEETIPSQTVHSDTETLSNQQIEHLEDVQERQFNVEVLDDITELRGTDVQSEPTSRIEETPNANYIEHGEAVEDTRSVQREETANVDGVLAEGRESEAIVFPHVDHKADEPESDTHFTVDEIIPGTIDDDTSGATVDGINPNTTDEVTPSAPANAASPGAAVAEVVSNDTTDEVTPAATVDEGTSRADMEIAAEFSKTPAASVSRLQAGTNVGAIYSAIESLQEQSHPVQFADLTTLAPEEPLELSIEPSNATTHDEVQQTTELTETPTQSSESRSPALAASVNEPHIGNLNNSLPTSVMALDSEVKTPQCSNEVAFELPDVMDELQQSNPSVHSSESYPSESINNINQTITSPAEIVGESIVAESDRDLSETVTESITERRELTETVAESIAADKAREHSEIVTESNVTESDRELSEIVTESIVPDKDRELSNTDTELAMQLLLNSAMSVPPPSAKVHSSTQQVASITSTPSSEVNKSTTSTTTTPEKKVLSIADYSHEEVFELVLAGHEFKEDPLCSWEGNRKRKKKNKVLHPVVRSDSKRTKASEGDSKRPKVSVLSTPFSV